MTSPEQAQQAHRTLRAYADAFANLNRTGWLSLFTDAAVVRDPADAEPVVGRDALAGFWDQAHARGRRMQLDVQRIVVCGAEAMLVFRLTVTPAAPKPPIMIDVCDIFRLADDGRIEEMRAYWDPGCIQR